MAQGRQKLHLSLRKDFQDVRRRQRVLDKCRCAGTGGLVHLILLAALLRGTQTQTALPREHHPGTPQPLNINPARLWDVSGCPPEIAHSSSVPEDPEATRAQPRLRPDIESHHPDPQRNSHSYHLARP